MPVIAPGSHLPLLKVSDAAGHELPFHFCPAQHDPANARTLVFLHGWCSADLASSWTAHTEWNVLAPKDRFGLYRAGCWWLGENGAYFMLDLMAQMMTWVRAELGGTWENREIYFAGNSMGGFGALVHGLSLRQAGLPVKAISVNVPQVRLFDTEFAKLHEPHLRAVFGDEWSTAPYADVTQLLDRRAPQENPLIFIHQTRFDVHREYTREQCLYLVDRLTEADCCFSLSVHPTKGHYNIVTAEQVFDLFSTWWPVINDVPRFDS